MALLKRETIRWRAAAAITLYAAWFLAALAAEAAAAPVASEYSVKAAYLSKFAPFVEWPPAVLPPGSPLQICIAGADPFGTLVEQTLVGQVVADHRIQVTRLARVDGQANCHVLYVRGSRAQSPAEALAAVRGKPVLTVTDEDDRGPARGMLHYVLVNNRVRFEVDPAAAMAGGLTISSKLLSLALVRPRGGR
jgi:hypothetical protein